MTTNEQIPCPVCGERMEIEEPRTKQYPDIFSCENEECPINECFYEKDIEFIERSIQLRIDKAVQAERERVIHWIINNPSPRADLFAKGWNGALDSIKNLIKQG